MSTHTIPASQIQPGDVIDCGFPTIVGYTRTVDRVEFFIFDGDEPFVRFYSHDRINPALEWKHLLPVTRQVTVTRTGS
jgi:hypothetical protein